MKAAPPAAPSLILTVALAATLLLCACVLPLPVSAQQVGTVSTFHVFDGYDGLEPACDLIQANDGSIYGTTSNGGTNQYSGTIFKITLDGTLTTLYNFSATSGVDGSGTNGDGAGPGKGVIEGKDGNFYGITRSGGANGHGTVFKLSPAGVLTTLYNFGADTSDPNPIVQGSDGNFYGTIEGASSGTSTGTGAIYQLTPAGVFTILHTFSTLDNNAANADGASPESAVT